MYDFNLKKDEELVYVFDDIYIKQKDCDGMTTVALTTKRLLFLDYLNIADELRITKYNNSIRFKEVYYDINLTDIKKIQKNKIILNDNTEILYDNNDLYKLLSKKK